MTALIDSLKHIADGYGPDKILLYTGSEDLMEKIANEFTNMPLIVSTHRPPMSKMLEMKNVHMRKTNYKPPVGLDVLDQAEDLVLSCFGEGLLESSDKVLFVISTDIETILVFDMKHIGAANLKDRLEGRLEVKVFESVFKLGSMIAREGKEGLPMGALLIVGDVNNVMNNTREMIKNPLEGCKYEELNILKNGNWNTIKEYSTLDGAVVFDELGNPISAGRYVLFDKNIEVDVERGLGGRHLAAASISKKTRAIAVVVSSEGNIRIYKDGERIYSVESI